MLQWRTDKRWVNIPIQWWRLCSTASSQLWPLQQICLQCLSEIPNLRWKFPTLSCCESKCHRKFIFLQQVTLFCIKQLFLLQCFENCWAYSVETPLLYNAQALKFCMEIHHKHGDIVRLECKIWQNEHRISISKIVQKYESQNCINNNLYFFVASSCQPCQVIKMAVILGAISLPIIRNCNQLTWLVAQEDFITFSWCDSFESHLIYQSIWKKVAIISSFFQISCLIFIT